ATAQALYAFASGLASAGLLAGCGPLYAGWGGASFFALALLWAVALPLALRGLGGRDRLGPRRAWSGGPPGPSTSDRPPCASRDAALRRCRLCAAGCATRWVSACPFPAVIGPRAGSPGRRSTQRLPAPVPCSSSAPARARSRRR